jgi:hypothetical protein
VSGEPAATRLLRDRSGGQRVTNIAAAGDEKILSHPSAAGSAPSAWLILGGPALFLLGHGAFKYVLWRVVPWTRLAGIGILALLALAVPVLPEIALAACAGRGRRRGRHRRPPRAPRRGLGSVTTRGCAPMPLGQGCSRCPGALT